MEQQTSMSLSDIARLAKVQRPVVSMWISRSGQLPFPTPIRRWRANPDSTPRTWRPTSPRRRAGTTPRPPTTWPPTCTCRRSARSTSTWRWTDSRPCSASAPCRASHWATSTARSCWHWPTSSTHRHPALSRSPRARQPTRASGRTRRGARRRVLQRFCCLRAVARPTPLPELPGPRGSRLAAGGARTRGPHGPRPGRRRRHGRTALHRPHRQQR